ncbi:competence protein [Marinosulfonomonas sp. PRT-SC04]|nr:competence protein [Marinosulfonomonas sp. PRT-SC04]
MRQFPNLIDLVLGQRGHLSAWVPVFLAIGVGTYFSLPTEPDSGAYATLAALMVGLAAAAMWLGDRLRLVFLALLLICTGLMLAGTRAKMVAEPVLGFRYYGPIEGRVVKVDRSRSDKMRLTLDRVVLERTPTSRTPAKVRVTLHSKQTFIAPEPGMVVILTGHLSAPQGPVEPDGFDFQRMAWFMSLGAVGYSRTPVLMLEPVAAGQAGLFINRLRMQISAGVQAIIPGDAGAFAAAIMTGDRSGMRREMLGQLRASNLAHLLAISGLHMGLLTAFVFGALRYGLALVPLVNLRFATKKIAASGALLAGAGYLALSGGNVATERAFIMVAVMLVAVLFDRRALTLRAVALAAIIVLIRRPEALTGPGFQMSFAATTALVAVFGALQHLDNSAVPRLLRPVLAVLISSFVAGAATAPIGAAHFNQIAHYGLLANMLTVPLMGILVVPAAVVAAVLYPLGLAWIGLGIMRFGVVWILGVAQWIAELDGAISHVVTPMPVVLPLIGLGMLWLILWQGRLRYVGILVALVGLGLWGMTTRPAVLISQSGGLVGLMGPQGRALSKPRGDSFSARNWLVNDGDAGIKQADAAQRIGFSGEKGVRRFEVGGQRFVHLTGRGAQARLMDECVAGRWVVTSAKFVGAELDGQRACTMIDAMSLKKTGALAIYLDEAGLRVVTTKARVGHRFWNSR